MSLRPMSTAVSATALTALMLFTAGCSGSVEVEKPSPSSSSSVSPSSSPDAEQKDPVDSGAAAAAIDPLNPPKPVASITAPLPYKKDRKATGRFDIYSVKRQGQLAILTFSVTPTISTVDPVSLFSLVGSHSFHPRMVDPINLREYEVVRGGGGSLSTNESSAEAYSGEPMFVWAAFAAPPTNVAKVNLNLFDALPTIMDVPLQ